MPSITGEALDPGDRMPVNHQEKTVFRCCYLTRRETVFPAEGIPRIRFCQVALDKSLKEIASRASFPIKVDSPNLPITLSNNAHSFAYPLMGCQSMLGG